MHLVLMTRGIQRQVDEWKHSLLAQRYAYKRKNLDTGKEEVHVVQGALRPIELWEYVFPAESINDVLLGMGINQGGLDRPEVKPVAWMLRKGMKLKPVPLDESKGMTGYTPKGTLNGEKMQPTAVHDMRTPGVAIYPIGIKEDEIKEYDWGKEGRFLQEGL